MKRGGMSERDHTRLSFVTLAAVNDPERHDIFIHNVEQTSPSPWLRVALRTLRWAFAVGMTREALHRTADALYHSSDPLEKDVGRVLGGVLFDTEGK